MELCLVFQWEVQHEGITCEEFADWKEQSNPELSAAGIEKLLEENGIGKYGVYIYVVLGVCIHPSILRFIVI